MFEIAPTTGVRGSPYYEATVAARVTGFTVYNQILLPLGYGDPERRLVATTQAVYRLCVDLPHIFTRRCG
ncbi:MAG: hypothetical protein O7G83_01210 [Proteobacteria bacterium]|nr:hypothetical protein [Pseudomonadota bacterium]